MTESGNSNFMQPAIPKLDGHYDHQRMLMENFIHSKEYWGLIENGILVVAQQTQSTEAVKIEEIKPKDSKDTNE